MSDIPQANPEDEIVQQNEREHLRPAMIFQGKELWPYNRGMKLFLFQVMSNDTNLFIYLAFVWMLIKRGEKTFKEDAAKHVAPVVWDINKFRAEIVDFCATLTDEDENDAERIYNEWLAAEERTRVKAGPRSGETDGTQKKTELIPAASPGTETDSPS